MIRFNLDGYRALIRSFTDVGYRSVGYEDVDPGSASLILRHDIDASLDHAVRQAEVNQELGVSATIFVLLSSDLYNLASAAGRRALRAMIDQGQHIGLHFDAACYGGDLASMEAAAKQEADTLATIAGAAPTAVSFHRPVKELQGIPGPFAGLPSAYDPLYFHRIEYCSDSRGRFYHGNPWEREAFAERRAFQLLTHPLWWMRDKELEPVAVLEDFECSARDGLRRTLAANSAPFADWLAQERTIPAGNL